jgi:hypothetical protein
MIYRIYFFLNFSVKMRFHGYVYDTSTNCLRTFYRRLRTVYELNFNFNMILDLYILLLERLDMISLDICKLDLKINV